jgi:hypothetical protein
VADMNAINNPPDQRDFRGLGDQGLVWIRVRLSCARCSVNCTFGSMEGHRAPNLVNNAIRCQLAQPGADVARSCAKSHSNVSCSQPVRAAAQNLNDPDLEITH